MEDHKKQMMMADGAIEMNVDGSINYMHPMCFVTKSGKNNTFHFHGAMTQDDFNDFIKVMVNNLDGHHKNKYWKLVPRKQIGKAKTVMAS